MEDSFQLDEIALPLMPIDEGFPYWHLVILPDRYFWIRYSSVHPISVFCTLITADTWRLATLWESIAYVRIMQQIFPFQAGTFSSEALFRSVTRAFFLNFV